MEEEIDLRKYVQVLVQYWKWITGAALIAATAALVVSFLLPPTYEATALVAVTKPRYVMQFDPRFETLDNIQPAYKAYPELASSDDLLRDLMERLDPLPRGVQTLRDVKEMVEAEGGADPSIIRLTVRARDPEEAARIANVWAALFVERANELYGTHNEAELHFFEEQLQRAEAELQSAEQALIEFQARNQQAILEAQLSSAQRDLEDYLIEQRELERVVRNARMLQDRVADWPAEAQATPGDDLTALLLELRAFDVQTSREGSEEVELGTGSSIWLQISDATLLASGRTAGELRAFLDGLATTLEARSAEIETRIAALEPRILSLQQQLQEMEAERDRLTRARDVAQETYMTLARKVEETRIAVEEVSGEVRLASQAAAPQKPAGPRKLLNTAVAGVLGLMLGVLGAFVVEWWRQEPPTEPSGRQEAEPVDER